MESPSLEKTNLDKEVDYNTNRLYQTKKYAITDQLVEYTTILNLAFSNRHTSVPSQFSWIRNLPTDSFVLANLKSEITKVFNQRSLGICWAVTIAHVISDQCVVRGISKKNPSISWSYLLSEFRNYGQCYGGQVVPLINNAITLRRPFLTNHCVDSSWVEGNGMFYFSEAREFGSQAKSISQYFQRRVPSPGCLSSANQRSFYLERIFEIVNSEHRLPPEIVREIVIKHLLTYGPIILSFPVLSNFLKHAEESSIYFEPKTMESAELVGFHATSIVGYGSQEVVYDGKRSLVTFWECRNSWGKTWGQDGMFRIATYPWNKHIQFEKGDVAFAFSRKTNSFVPTTVSAIFVVVEENVEYYTKPPALFNENFLLLKNSEFYNADESKLVDVSVENFSAKGDEFEEKCIRPMFENRNVRDVCTMAEDAFPENFIYKKSLKPFWFIKPDADELGEDVVIGFPG